MKLAANSPDPGYLADSGLSVEAALKQIAEKKREVFLRHRKVTLGGEHYADQVGAAVRHAPVRELNKI